jgi:putative hydrolase of the HAD superfamily
METFPLKNEPDLVHLVFSKVYKVGTAVFGVIFYWHSLSWIERKRWVMVKAVMFDLDGTLLNRDDSIQKFIKYQYERLQHWLSHIPKEWYIARFIELDDRGYVWKDTVYQQIVKEFEIHGLTWEDLLEDYLKHFHQSCVPFPNLMWMLEELKRKSLKLGIITNGKGPFQMHSIFKLIYRFFGTIFIERRILSEKAGLRCIYKLTNKDRVGVKKVKAKGTSDFVGPFTLLLIQHVYGHCAVFVS